ncbi:MAG: VIT domain-containing protein [Pyrinomonadaceae bacterium]
MQKFILPTLLILLFTISMRANPATQGELNAVGTDGKAKGLVPLKHTDVKAEITGFLSRVKVRQEFENNFTEKIEAVYVFPLPDEAAVDDMTMHIGERVVRGKIMKREEAREVYEAAKSNGQIASLLDQERPNIFTQSVANILPGEKIVIEISYVETLKYEAGSYEFVFPMVVGPRYIPGNPTGNAGGGFAPDTDRVPDGSRITPPVAKERAGHDISIDVRLDAGVLIDKIESKSHEVDSAMLSASSYEVKLRDRETIPNKDFILRYDVAGKRIEDAILMHKGERGGYFTLILQPPERVNSQDVTPKEIVFVVDTSGSMSGFPLDKAKESMKMALDGLNPQDTFNLITFAGDTRILFDKPVPATASNLAQAQEFLSSHRGGGGTEMMKAIRAALEPSDSQQHIRVVCFMTDGYVGNEGEILSEIQKHPNARIFSFGIGSSVNRYLLDKMAEEGRGEVEYVSLKDDGSAAAKRFHERVRNPLLTDISVDFGKLEVDDVYPRRINDLFSAKPVIIHGRFKKAGRGKVKLIGKSFGRETVREIDVNFPENQPAHDVLATLWARTRIDDLTKQDYAGVQNGNAKAEIKDTITSLGLEFRLMTQFTSFVAVEERVVTNGGQPVRIQVPVEMPEGVSRSGVFGEFDEPVSIGAAAGKKENRKYKIRRPAPTPANKTDSKIRADYAADKTVQEQTLIVTGEEEKSVYQPVTGVALPKPVFPADARSKGEVRVEVTLDNAGRVISARAKSGPKEFYQAAEKAAGKASFALPELQLEIKRVTGEIVYNFKPDKTVEVSQNLEDVRIEVKPNKYHSSVRALVERLKTNGPAGADEAGFVRDGRASVTVRVTSLTPEVIAGLKNLGFEVLAEMASARALVGQIPIEKISALAELEAVTFISPQNR